MKIPIVNEQDEVIGEEDRSIIHRDGLKHREIHVWLVTPEKEFIFSKRGPNQDTWPNRFDVTCGGHVDTVSETYQECAERELFEETGQKNKITFITKDYYETYDPSTNTHNNVFRATFAGIYSGKPSDLKVEEGHGKGFIKFSKNDLLLLSEQEKNKFIPTLLSGEYLKFYDDILEKIFN